MRNVPLPLVTFCVLAILALVATPAAALISGGTGNEPLNDPGWPTGGAEIFNDPGRVAYWEGPPYGGGQWHAECRGDAAAFNAVLERFATVDAKVKRLVVRDGVGHSFWLNPGGESEKQEAAEIDWVLSIWAQKSWEQMLKMPRELVSSDLGDAESGPPAQIEVFTGGRIRWADVRVPAGIEVVDNRLESHGLSLADSAAFEGRVTDGESTQPITALVRLERIEPQSEGGYAYPEVANTETEGSGRWMLTQVAPGWYRVVVEADGYVPRVVGHKKTDDQPYWQRFDTALSRSAPLDGRVVDEAGAPLAGAKVSIWYVFTASGKRYESPRDYETTTDEEGRFAIDWAPVGSGRIWVHKSGYVRSGLGQDVHLPAQNLELRMAKSAQLRVTVDFGKVVRPNEYIVDIEPEGGLAVGSWGGSHDVKNDDVVLLENVPPGRYVITGRPNPGRDADKTDPITVELTGGSQLDVTLTAK
jgi:hypothetical protein